MTNQTVLVLVITFSLVWGLQMAAGGWQARRFMRAVRQVRIAGRTAIGIGGSRMHGKAYVALAVDAADRVVAATSLSGRTVLARPTPVTTLVGHHLDDLRDPSGGPLAGTALGGAAADAASHLQEISGETEPVEP